MKLYIKVIFTILFLILLETLLSYKDLYPPYLDWENALMIIFIQTLLAFFLILSFLMPVVTTSFTLSLSGKTFSLRLLNFVALLISVPTAIYFYIDSGSASFISSQLLTERLTKQNFRDDFRESSDVFLNYYHPRLPQTEEGFLELPELTLKYQRQINGITKAEESDFFKVFGVLESLETPDPQRRWLGIYMEISPKKELFYLYSPEGVEMVI